MIIRKAYKFRLKTNRGLSRKLAQFAGCSRLIWNKGLAFQKERLNSSQSCLSYAGLTKELTQWKKEEGLFFLKQVHSQALQQSLKNLSQALKEAFDKTNPKKFPRFKKKGQGDSFRYPQGFKVDNENGRIFLPKIGWVRYFHSQDVIGEAKNITISKRGKHWFVSIQVEIDRVIQPPIVPPNRGDAEGRGVVGGDLGIARFLTLSNQEYYEPISIFKKLKAKLAKLQKKLAKKEKFSNRWRRLKSKISKLHIRIADTRNDYLQDNFINNAQDFYQAEVSNLDFKNSSAKNTINQWVADHTANKIPQIVDSVSPEDVLYLINAIYFKGSWTNKFEADATTQQPFYLQPDQQKSVAMMSQTGEYKYYDHDLFQVIRLSYGEKAELGMYIFLPQESSSLEKFNQQLNLDNWQDWISHRLLRRPKGYTFGYKTTEPVLDSIHG